MKTKVIFRKFKDYGEIIALFPELPGDNSRTTCLSYMHVGQHGAASDYLPNTGLATPNEYADLKKELELIGYDLQVCKRQSYKMQLNRWNEIMRG